jgi:hypothetical protein
VVPATLTKPQLETNPLCPGDGKRLNCGCDQAVLTDAEAGANVHILTQLCPGDGKRLNCGCDQAVLTDPKACSPGCDAVAGSGKQFDECGRCSRHRGLVSYCRHRGLVSSCKRDIRQVWQAGAQFTCFTSTKVQTPTPAELCAWQVRGRRDAVSGM